MLTLFYGLSFLVARFFYKLSVIAYILKSIDTEAKDKIPSSTYYAGLNETDCKSIGQG